MDSLPAVTPGAVLHLCHQRSDVWRQLRCGRATASKADAIMPPVRGREKVATHDYLRQLVTEQLTKRPQDQVFSSAAMRRGRELENGARAAYAAHTGQRVAVSGFLAHPTLMAGCSLDGHVGGQNFDGIVEIKAPNTLTHWKYGLTHRVPRPYRAQIVHQLWITGAKWCDFVSFDDRLPARWQLVVVRVERDEQEVAAYDRCIRAFLAEVDAQVRALESLPPLLFFERAPLEIARDVLSQCGHLVRARHAGPVRAPRTRPVQEAV
jgi:putative phage-type endonuclease